MASVRSVILRDTRYHAWYYGILRSTVRYTSSIIGNYEVIQVVLRVTTSYYGLYTMRYYEKFKVIPVVLRVTTKYYERCKVLRVVF